MLTSDGGRALVGGLRVEPLHDGAGAGGRVGQPRGQPGDLDAPAHGAVGIEVPQQGLGHIARGLRKQLDGGELLRLVVVDPAGQGIPDCHLDGNRHRSHAEGDEEADPVVAVAAPAQHGEGVDGRDQESPHDISGDDHVGGHERHGVVEDHLHRIDVGDLPGRVEGEARRSIHPRVGGDHRCGAEDAGDHQRNAGPEMRPRAQPAPAVDVDRDEDGLGEEEDPLEGERNPERVAPLAHEARPQQAELEGEHRASDGTHRERDRHVLRPALCQLQRVRIVALEAPVVGDQRHERPRHAQRDQDDVARQSEGHLSPRPRHGVDRQDGHHSQEGHHPKPSPRRHRRPHPDGMKSMARGGLGATAQELAVRTSVSR